MRMSMKKKLVVLSRYFREMSAGTHSSCPERIGFNGGSLFLSSANATLPDLLALEDRVLFDAAPLPAGEELLPVDLPQEELMGFFMETSHPIEDALDLAERLTSDYGEFDVAGLSGESREELDILEPSDLGERHMVQDSSHTDNESDLLLADRDSEGSIWNASPLRFSHVNQQPAAMDDIFVAADFSPLRISGADLLSNDAGPPGRGLAIVWAGNSLGGALRSDGNGGFVFQFEPGSSGEGSFQYQTTDGVSTSELATVRVLVVVSPQEFRQPGDYGDFTSELSHSQALPPVTDLARDNNVDEPEEPGVTGSLLIATGPIKPGFSLYHEFDGNPESWEETGDSDPRVAVSPHVIPAPRVNPSKAIYGYAYQSPEGPVSVNESVSRMENPRTESEKHVAGFEIVSHQKQFNKVAEQLLGQVEIVHGATAAATAIAGAFTAGYVIWMARGGMLLAGLVTALPAWKAFDPLPVLQYKATADDDDGETLQTLINQENHRSTAADP